MIILGATGSIGRAALEVAQSLNGDVRIVGLAAGTRWRELAEQAARFEVPRVAVADDRCYRDLRAACPAHTKVLAGPDGLLELVVDSPEANFVLSAIVGAAGLPPTLAAVERGLDVGLANKESLVVAGAILAKRARARGGRLIPVDSEHSAIFQALQSGRREEVRRVYLTASGGPFRTWTRERIAAATLEDALNHPTWDMGPKITIDSATMMNKALEVIEARWLFELRPEEIEVLVHPESIIHSMVEYCDGSIIAQLGAADMKTPIQYAITYPRRVDGVAKRLCFRETSRLSFEPPDFDRFPALRLGYEAARAGGAAGAVLNAANEAAVERFRAREIPFGMIAELCADVLSRRQDIEDPTLAQLLECDQWARREAQACIHS